MKKILSRVLMAIGLVFIVAVGGLLVESMFAQSPYYYTLIVRTFLDVRGKAVITDSLRVIGTTTLQGAVTQSGGLSAVDSLSVPGIVKTGGATSNGTSSFYIKQLASRLYMFIFKSSTNAANGTIDSSFNIVQSRGKFVAADSMRSQGPFLSNGAATFASTGSFTGKATFGGPGQNLTLRTIAAGDSVFLHVIVDAADTTLKVWNGSAWVTIKDLIP